MPRDFVEAQVPQITRKPRTKREAQRLLTDELIYALSARPKTFELRGRFTLDDKKSGMRWWIANGPLSIRLHSVSDCSCGELDIGLVNKFRVWFAIRKWKSNQVERPDIPHIHEAIRLVEANRP